MNLRPEPAFEGGCGDEVFSFFNQEAVPYAMAEIISEAMNAAIFTLPESTEPQKSQKIIKLLNRTQEETGLQTGVWLDKYEHGIKHIVLQTHM